MVRVLAVLDHRPERLLFLERHLHEVEVCPPDCHLATLDRLAPLLAERAAAAKAREEQLSAALVQLVDCTMQAINILDRYSRADLCLPAPLQPKPWMASPRRQRQPATSRTAYHPAPRRPGFRGARPR
jgi:hypothetical protein